ncbi:MAG: YdcF family protein, partial [Acidobacteria bacterium]|nr:YdcF family protein [Acidobacteriota bacterium]
DELMRLNIPAERIIILPQTVTSTYEEAALVLEYARANNLRSILFVTSAYHTRRALWTIRHVFAGSGVVLGLEAPPPGEETPRPLTWWLHAAGWLMVAEEYPKLIYYRLWYG